MKIYRRVEIELMLQEGHHAMQLTTGKNIAIGTMSEPPAALITVFWRVTGRWLKRLQICDKLPSPLF